MDSPLLKLPNTFRVFYGAFASLFPFQIQSIDPILQDRDLILQSGTGSGKTEGVLAPCLERVILSGGLDRLLYVVPTRALAFDLKRRLAPVITPRLGLGLGVRTGDIKRRGGRTPHLMITTPESLDVLLGSKNPDLRAYVAAIRMVIIDEVHPLVHEYRGRQLALVLQRLQRRTGRPLQKIALSATIGDMEAIERFFDFRNSSLRIVEDVRKAIRPHLIHLKNESDELIALFHDLYHTYTYRKILLFANSRATCDRLFALLGAHGAFSGACGLHYSNLKPERRRDVEHHFRQSPHALCVATSTLELGIDVGDVDAVVLYEPPDSVSAFLQRIGRANRGRDTTVFWGICRGARAGEQLTRFLGLLALAQQGRVEKPRPKRLHSVLCQQIASCLYEKQRISSGAMHDLFPEESRTLDAVLHTMQQKGWLSRGAVQGLFQGGRQYTDALIEHGLWSNFPPAEEEYALILEDKAIADIPRALVTQLEPGDRVNLAGNGLLITAITHSQGSGQVQALPSSHRDAKELFWLGPGQQVSYETAQSVRDVVTGSKETETGLFSRTRALLENERDTLHNAATLKNGLEVLVTPAGLFRYLTYLGSVGNLILGWSIREHLHLSEAEDVLVDSDALGVECSHLIDFSRLPLPLSRDDLTRWTGRYFKLLQASFPLNRFCSTLPQDLHLAEMADFLYDERIMEAFSRYHEQSSEICRGRLDFLENTEQDGPSPAESIPAAGRPLLDLEKERQSPLSQPGLDCPDRADRPLTGSILAGYFRHFQCERFIRFHFLPKHLQPASRLPPDQQQQLDERLEQGRRFEESVMLHLQQMGAAITSIPIKDEQGNLRPVQRRYRETLAALQNILKLPDTESLGPRYLSQGVLYDQGLLRKADAVGIPDLIRISGDHKNRVLMVGDIKNSRAPRLHQQWQVAFYASLLERMSASLETESSVSIAKQGFLLVPALDGGMAAEQHEFDLSPFFSALPGVLHTLDTLLGHTHRDAAFHLTGRCTDCPWFDSCYGQALEHEDIRFLPNLSPGQLDHLHALGLTTLDEAEHWLESSSIEAMPMPAAAGKALRAKIKALTTHAFLPGSTLTRLYPATFSTSIILFAVPGRSAREATLGLWVADAPEGAQQPRTWEIHPGSNEEQAQWRDFTNVFSAIVDGSLQADHGPQIFSFGPQTPRRLLAWAKAMGAPSEYAMIEELLQHHWTDLKQVFKTHFALPVPGELTLYDLGQVLDLGSSLQRPHSLLHQDRHHTDVLEALRVLDSMRRWIMARVQSSRRQDGWKTASAQDDPAKRYVHFLEEQQQLRQEDIASLQACSLKERVERFRALGPLRFTGKELDAEGRFQYTFSLTQDAGPGKFRNGDFLKLAHAGTRHLQDGFSVILTRFDPAGKTLSLSSRQGPLSLNRRMAYSLEEDAEDWSTPKLIHGITSVLNVPGHPVSRLLQGRYQEAQTFDSSSWIRKWLDLNQNTAGLNTAQRKAMELVFDQGLGLIDGPPGTGKTHLLGWLLIALILCAQDAGKPVRILISALTHQAIDNALFKVSTLLKRFRLEGFPAAVIKWGESPEFEDSQDSFGLRYSTDPQEIFQCRSLILGATGYGLYRLFDSQNGRFPGYFDWIALDEASQMLIPQAVLSLAYGKGNYCFFGDVKQLPPIVLGRDEPRNHASPNPVPKREEVHTSILEQLFGHYGPKYRVRLNVTYRMNRALCEFPSRTWYDEELHPTPENAESKLQLDKKLSNDALDRFIDPNRPVVLGILDHLRQHQECEAEADVMARIAGRLITHFAVSPEQMALISPHRAQNNLIRARLMELVQGASPELPLIDTVERVQGAEREVIIFGFTTSDRDQVTSPFLNNPNRFNVVITRARQKLMVIGSRAFFQAIPNREKDLADNACFKQFLRHCKDTGSLFFL